MVGQEIDILFTHIKVGSSEFKTLMVKKEKKRKATTRKFIFFFSSPLNLFIF